MLPVAAAGGWVAVRRSQGSSTAKFWSDSQNFHQQVNQLLAEQQFDEQLFDTFSEGGSDAADTHIALGNLYRRRGEFNRAIRIHESIMNIQQLDVEVRTAAHFELARDYDVAGLMDRSEQELRALIKSGQYIDDAYEGLLQLHEREQDWLQAVKVALQYEADANATVAHKLSHYYCELATNAFANTATENAEASRLASLALKHWPASARAHVQLADIALSGNAYDKAIQHYNHVEGIDPSLMPVIIDNSVRDRQDPVSSGGQMGYRSQRLVAPRSTRTATSVLLNS